MASRADLRSRGATDADIRAAVRRGVLIRLRRGRYASPDVHPDVARAVAAGGRLTCHSALRLHGVWVLEDRLLHVAVDHGAKRTPAAGIRLHWRTPSATPPSSWGTGSGSDKVLAAIDQLFHCGTPLATVIAIDSALNQGLVREADVRATLGPGTRAAWVLDRIDGRSQSGTETMVRVALRGRQIAVRIQVQIAGVGRVDTVIGDRLVVEIDSRAWHDTEDQYEVDRRRDSALVAAGYLVIRITYRRLMEDWAGVEREILAVIRRGDHTWGRRRQRRGV